MLGKGNIHYSMNIHYSLLHDLPLKLTKLSIYDQEIKRASYKKFLGVI